MDITVLIILGLVNRNFRNRYYGIDYSRPCKLSFRNRYYGIDNSEFMDN